MSSLNEQNTVGNEEKTKNHSETTAIRISSNIYEALREIAFFERTTIRQVADDILEDYLKKLG